MSGTTSSISRALLAGVTLSLAGTAATADALASTFSLRVLETGIDGQDTLVERASVRPGEVIQYDLRHENTSDEALAGIVIAAPVPKGVILQIGDQTTSLPALFEVQAELDPEREGLEWSVLPAMRKVLGDDGLLHEEPLPREAVAAVRWTFSEPLAPGADALNTYRVRVE